MTLPHTRRADWPDLRPDRFARLIRAAPEGCSIALLGLPFDGGVRLNGGRVGAAEGPAALRAALGKFAVSYDLVAGRKLDGVGVFDAGDVVPVAPEETGGDAVAALHATHERVTTVVSELVRLGLVPVCIGGGHDLTFASARALPGHVGTSIGGINVDAHLDVRAEVGSGMPFRALIEGGFLEASRFVELGIGRFTSGRAHVEWLEERGGSIVDIEAARVGLGGASAELMDDVFGVAFEGNADSRESRAPGFVSVDLDAIDGAQAPGVSAVNPMGLDVAMVARVVDRAGRTPGVHMLDIMELNPAHDDGRTARIGALLFMTFVAAFAERPGRGEGA